MQERYPIPEEELRLIEGCLAQDRRAQKALYDKYKDAMYTLAFRITADSDLAQDALQEAFLGVFMGIRHFQRRSTLGAWIKTIVIRQAYKRIRKENPSLPIEAVPPEYAISWSNPLEAEYLEKVIQALPPGYRSVFVLVEIEGFRHKEVAEILGISVGTSKSQLFHAKKMLKKQLSHLVHSS